MWSALSAVAVGTLVLDLDETLVHSSTMPVSVVLCLALMGKLITPCKVPDADLEFQVECHGSLCTIYAKVRGRG